MSHEPETSQELLLRAHATSFTGEQHIELGISPTPPLVQELLPERYDLPLFELLVVDTRYVFVSWEVSADQLVAARQELGAAFESRRLLARFYAVSEPDTVLTEAELYGEVGRWFIDLSQPGRDICARLGFAAGEAFVVLSTAGPVSIPREQAIEPQEFEELRVSYGLGIHGELVILGLRHKHDAAWPDVTLPSSGYHTPRPREHPRLRPISGGLGSGGVSAAPSSADLAFYNLSSPAPGRTDDSDGGRK